MSSIEEKQGDLFRELDAEKILKTTRLLCSRVSQRFPNSGLNMVCTQLGVLAEEAQKRAAWLARPHLWWRIASVCFSLLLVAIPITTVYYGCREFKDDASSRSDFFQGVDALVNELILVSAAVYFFASIEKRLKRKTALKSLNELRSMAHIIDMHQLTKDPEVFAGHWIPSEASPPRAQLTPFLLARYLDYCSEMLAVLSKLSALYLQSFEDEFVQRAVDEVESLTAGLAQKIWQKITIIDRLHEH
jgi:hypothetical protein